MELYANTSFSCKINNTLPEESFFFTLNMSWLLEGYTTLI